MASACWKSSDAPALYQTAMGKVMLSDEDDIKIPAPIKVANASRQHKPGTVLAVAIVLACILGIGLGVGLGVGLSKKDKQDTASTTVFENTNTTILASHLADASADAIAGLNAAFLHLSTEAIHDAYSWEGYIVARASMSRVLPSLAVLGMSNADAATFMKTLLEADLLMIDYNDVDATYIKLQALTGLAQRALASASSLSAADVPSPVTVLKRLQGFVNGTLMAQLAASSSNIASRHLMSRRTLLQTATAKPTTTNELVLLDVHQSLMAFEDIINSLPESSVLLPAVRSSLLEAITAVTIFADEEADLWLTKVVKAQTCDQQVEDERQKCTLEVNTLLAGEGCVAGADCQAKVAKKEAECTSKVGESRLKCSNRRAFLKKCGDEYEARLGLCRAALPSSGTTDLEALISAQWACKDTADTARNVCIQREEYLRKCDEESDKSFAECMAKKGAVAATCGASNTTVRADCIAKEQPKRMDCKVSKRMEEIRKCASIETTGRSLCVALLSSDNHYDKCMADHNGKMADCKYKIEYEVKKCEEESTCKITEASAKAKCQATFEDAQSKANDNATAIAQATAVHGTCETAAKAASEECKVSAMAKVAKWTSEQDSKKEIVTTVQRYHEYLPYTLLVQQQRASLQTALSKLSAALGVE